MAGSNMRKALLLILLLVILVPCLATEHGPRHLQLFAHGSVVPPDNTFIVSAVPSGTTTGIDEFGLIRTVSNVLRDGSADDSQIVGSQVGVLVVGKKVTDLYVSFTYAFNENATHQGTIAVHGFIDGTFIGDRVFAVVGGTGDFLHVFGEDRSAYDPVEAPNPYSIVNAHNLTLHYAHDQK
ncbi:unnamed protein product [Calypogeia fissa]